LSGITEIQLGHALAFPLSQQYDLWADTTHMAAENKASSKILFFIRNLFNGRL
jgi:hypothetical protein